MVDVNRNEVFLFIFTISPTSLHVSVRSDVSVIEKINKKLRCD
jgi:hypothetical protein